MNEKLLMRLTLTYILIQGPPPPPMFNMGGGIPPPPKLPSMGGPMPLPPPIALNTGPGKLQSQTSTNVTSSTAANGSKPKPLPLIPASELYLTNSESNESQLVSYQFNLLFRFLIFELGTSTRRLNSH